MSWKESGVVDERLKFVARLLEGEKMAPLCREFGISRKTGYKIYDVTDESFHGFTVRIHPTGKKVFIIRYQLTNGERGRFTLGKFGVDRRSS